MAIAERENTEFVDHSIEAPKSLNLPVRRKELEKIDKENVNTKRLEKCAPFYKHSKWDQHWELQENLMKSICEYPYMLPRGRKKRKQKKRKKRARDLSAPGVSHNMLGDFIRLHQSVVAQEMGDKKKVMWLESISRLSSRK